MSDRNCLSYWFPLLQAAGLPVPETLIVRTECSLIEACEIQSEDDLPPGFREFIAELRTAADRIGYPCFLRTGQGSGKHNWKQTCYLTGPERIDHHVVALVVWSETVDMIGLPWNVWAVRKMLPTMPVCALPAYGDMPLAREARAFVRDGDVLCVHPYWPEGAVREGFPSVDVAKDRLAETRRYFDLPDNFAAMYLAVSQWTTAEEGLIRGLASRAGAVLGGDWSVDILETRAGWYVTDCAEAGRSFHWPGCKAVPI